MQPTKLLVIGDVHICDHAPGRREDGYKQNILDKLYECVDIAKANDVSHILFLGDIFHLKAANRVSHRLVQDMATVLSAFGLPIYILVGNHDITDGTLDSLVKQPLGTLGHLPYVTLLQNEPLVLDDDICIYPVPGTSDVTIDDFEIAGSRKRDIMVVHQSIVPDISKEKEMLQDILLDAKEVANRTNIDIILYGHQHRSDGLYRVTRDNGSPAVFSNLGSICRLTIDDNDVKKEPAVLVLGFDNDDNRTVSTEVIKLTKVLSPQDAYKLDEHLEEKEHSLDIEDTIKKLKEAEVSAFSIEGVVSDVESRADLDKDVQKVTLDLLEEVR